MMRIAQISFFELDVETPYLWLGENIYREIFAEHLDIDAICQVKVA